MQLLEFEQEGQRYLIDMTCVDRVVSLQDLEDQQGDTNAISRVEVDRLLDLPVSKAEERQGLILNREKDRVMLVVDRVRQIVEVADSGVRSSPPRVQRAEGGAIIRGFVEREDGLVALLDIEAI